MSRLFLFPLFAFSFFMSQAQDLDINSSYERYVRRLQLINQDSPRYSMAIKPILIPNNEDRLLRRIWGSKNANYLFNTLPLSMSIENYSRNPHPTYNGTMLPSKGAHLLLSPGVSFTSPFLKIQLKPELYLSQNQEYPGFPQLSPEALKVWPNGKRWTSMYRWYNQIDMPESFGSEPIQTFLPGQSYVKARFRNLAFGLSTQNIWWGPGKYNSLVMTNNARGFQHYSLESEAPLITPLGNFEFQIVLGKLVNSGHIPPDTSKTSGKTKLYNPKPDLERNFNGMALVYQPKWVNGLYLGVNAGIQQYSETAKHYQDYLPVLTDVLGFGDHRKDTLVRQQISSIFFRWTAPLAEFYFEYGRNNASWKIKDLKLNPYLDAAYVAGFTKLVPLKNQNTFLEFNVELTQLQQAPDVQIAQKAPRSWYIHSLIRQGYTNNGEVMGNRAGPGGNIQILEVSWVRNFNKFGFYFERFVHNNDFVYVTFNGSFGGDFRNYWVDHLFGLSANFKYHRFLIDTKFSYVRSLNYQWEIIPGEPFLAKGSGMDTDNFIFKANLTYLF